MEKFAGLSDENLYTLACKWGRQAQLWRQKFAGLLPEINRRRLYEKKNFGSIFEFAARLCGMSEQQVRLAINLDVQFDDKPALKKLLVNGEASISKLVRIAAVATPENEAELAEKIQLLSKSAVETLVRDMKYQNGSREPKNELKSLPGQRLNFEFSNEIIKELNDLHTKGFDMNALVIQMLQKRTEEIQQKKQEVGEEMLAKAAVKKPSRHVPLKVKNILHEEFGTKCAVVNCKKSSKPVHHKKRFAMSPDHDPREMSKYCEDHHTLAHTIDVNYQRAKEQAFELN